MSTRKVRGRPIGSTPYPADGQVLARVADMICADSTLTATAAMKQLNYHEEAALRRLQRKWQRCRDEQITAAVARRQLEPERRTAAAAPLPSIFEQIRLGETLGIIRGAVVAFADAKKTVEAAMPQLTGHIAMPESIRFLEAIAARFSEMQKQWERDFEPVRRAVATHNSQMAELAHTAQAALDSLSLPTILRSLD